MPFFASPQSCVERRAPRFLAWAAFTITAGSASLARADGGYFDGVKGAHASGRAGAFAARADDVSAVAINPAGLTHIGTTQIQIGNRFSFNEHTYARNPTLDWGNIQNGVPPYTEFARVKNGAPWQALDPFIGISTNLGLRDWAFAAAIFSPAGTAREVYPLDGGQRYMMVRRNAQMIDYNLSAAWKYQEIFGVGLSLQALAVPTLDYGLVIDGESTPGRVNPVSSGLDIHANVKGSDLFTLNAILGFWVRPTKWLEIGLSGQFLPSKIETNSKLSVGFAHPAANTDNNIELQRNGVAADDVHLELPLPMNARLGVRYRGLDGDREKFDIELDAMYETWSRVKNFRLDSNGLVANYRGQNVNIGVIDIAKQWQDTIGVHLGGDYVIADKRATVRGGVYYETPVAKPAYSNVDFADGTELGAALGGSLYFGKFELALAAEYRVQPTVVVADADAQVYQQTPGTHCTAPYTSPANCNAAYIGVPSPPVNGGTYTAYSLIGTLEASYRF